jgi:hypothetical protein
VFLLGALSGVVGCAEPGDAESDSTTDDETTGGELSREAFLDELNQLICDFNSRCDLGSPPKWPGQEDCSFDTEVAASCLEYAREQYADRECSEYFVSLIVQCSDAWYACKSMG